MSSEMTSSYSTSLRSQSSCWVEVRQLPLLALLGSLWTVVELQLGNELHWARVPFAGAVLTAAALFILVTVRQAVPRRGSVAAVTFVVVILKLGFGGPGAPYTALGILIEGGMVELLLPGAGPTFFGAALAGAAAMSWCLVHPFLTQGILAGSGILRVYAILIQRSATLFGLQPESGWIVLALVWFAHALLGVVSGVLAVHFSAKIASLIRPAFPITARLSNRGVA